jgi:hypothetical protein
MGRFREANGVEPYHVKGEANFVSDCQGRQAFPTPRWAVKYEFAPSPDSERSEAVATLELPRQLFQLNPRPLPQRDMLQLDLRRTPGQGSSQKWGRLSFTYRVRAIVGRGTIGDQGFSEQLCGRSVSILFFRSRNLICNLFCSAQIVARQSLEQL